MSSAFIIPAQPGFTVHTDGLVEPVIAWLFDPSRTLGLRPIPLTPSGEASDNSSLLDADGFEVFAG